jgi:hypothetical protein
MPESAVNSALCVLCVLCVVVSFSAIGALAEGTSRPTSRKHASYPKAYDGMLTTSPTHDARHGGECPAEYANLNSECPAEYANLNSECPAEYANLNSECPAEYAHLNTFLARTAQFLN